MDLNYLCSLSVKAGARYSGIKRRVSLQHCSIAQGMQQQQQQQRLRIPGAPRNEGIWGGGGGGGGGVDGKEDVLRGGRWEEMDGWL